MGDKIRKQLYETAQDINLIASKIHHTAQCIGVISAQIGTKAIYDEDVTTLIETLRNLRRDLSKFVSELDEAIDSIDSHIGLKD